MFDCIAEIRQLDSDRQSLVYNHHHELIAASDTIGAVSQAAQRLFISFLGITSFMSSPFLFLFTYSTIHLFFISLFHPHGLSIPLLFIGTFFVDARRSILVAILSCTLNLDRGSHPLTTYSFTTLPSMYR
jgi:hypothetical protein